MKNDIIPVALFTYSRPQHLKKTLLGLKNNNVPLIYAFSDGPKDKISSGQVKKVREILSEINWTDIITFKRKKNLGLGTSIRLGVSEVLKKHDKVIVVEDDIVLRKGAYKYTCDALNYFENDEKVMSVSMWTNQVITPIKSENGFFSERFVCWGWGTYKKDWEFYKNSPEELYKEVQNQKIDALKWGKDIEWQVNHAQERNLWYVGYLLMHFLNGKLSFFPPESLVTNIGMDGSGVNTGKRKEDEIIENEFTDQFNPPPIEVYPRLNKKFKKYFDNDQSIITKMKISVYKLVQKMLNGNH